MNARELHDWMRNIADTEPDADVLVVTRGFYETILRALDLLARVEESEDELVRELRRAIDISGGPTGGGAGHYLNKMAVKAAAALVALRAERDRLLKGEFICRKCWLRKDGEIDGQPDF